jgi:diacylglycerol kinase family enzyme
VPVRALLVANPAATSTTPGTRDVIVGALRSHLDLEVVWTERRGHAVELGRRARRDRLDLVLALGGDGTVNELVNGLLGEDGAPGADATALAVLPGGSTNVFARALGMPRDPVEATGTMLHALREGRRRRVTLGRADGRWFTFAGGVGLDAEVVRRVEALRAKGRVSRPSLFVRTTTRTIARRHPVPEMVVDISGADPVRARMVIFGNTRPWTYLGERPLDPFPDASFDGDLEVFAMPRIGLVTVGTTFARLLAGRPPSARSTLSAHAVGKAVVSSDEPFPVEVDGEALPPRRVLVVESVPAALPVISGFPPPRLSVETTDGFDIGVSAPTVLGKPQQTAGRARPAHGLARGL